jgi:hypothetical protein
MEHNNYILMADIIGSRNSNQTRLMDSFQSVVNYINQSENKNILSPITITLGDEFQGVVKDLPAALHIILRIEEQIITSGSDFKLRYVLLQGEIETKINPQIAYGMMGSGLTDAREHLLELKKSKYRFNFNLVDEKKTQALNNAFIVLQGLIDGWNIKRDYYIVTEFLEHKDYKTVATDLNKEPSLMWKREKSLKLDKYFAIKEVIAYIGDPNE